MSRDPLPSLACPCLPQHHWGTSALSSITVQFSSRGYGLCQWVRLCSGDHGSGFNNKGPFLAYAACSLWASGGGCPHYGHPGAMGNRAASLTCVPEGYELWRVSLQQSNARSGSNSNIPAHDSLASISSMDVPSQSTRMPSSSGCAQKRASLEIFSE